MSIENSIIPSLNVVKGRVKTTSIAIADHFSKRHADVMRAIQTLEIPDDFNERNFALVDYTDPKGEKRPIYEMTRDGFTLVAMGFTGKKALKWKLAYIEAFNIMEDALLEKKGGYHFPAEAAKPYNTLPNNQAWFTIPQLMHHASGNPIFDLISQVEANGNNIDGAKIQFDAMCHQLEQIEPIKELAHDLDRALSGIFSRGMNVKWNKDGSYHYLGSVSKFKKN